jgi:hypothetical protein
MCDVHDCKNTETGVADGASLKTFLLVNSRCTTG